MHFTILMEISTYGITNCVLHLKIIDHKKNRPIKAVYLFTSYREFFPRKVEPYLGTFR